MIGWSNFALERHRKCYSEISESEILKRTVDNWSKRVPGAGETDTNRKVLVPIDPSGLFLNTIQIYEGMDLESFVTRRQPEEDFFIQTLAKEETLQKANFCNVICYSKEALLENNGVRSTEEDWEIVAVLSLNVPNEPMEPLTMARNFLEKSGGTKSSYSAQEFAEAIYYWSLRVKLN
jgi:hypothetical protein